MNSKWTFPKGFFSKKRGQEPTFPVVDAVPVVRCKDCYDWGNSNHYEFKIDGVKWKYCPYLDRYTDECFFCKGGFDIHGQRGKV